MTPEEFENFCPIIKKLFISPIGGICLMRHSFLYSNGDVMFSYYDFFVDLPHITKMIEYGLIVDCCSLDYAEQFSITDKGREYFSILLL